MKLRPFYTDKTKEIIKKNDLIYKEFINYIKSANPDVLGNNENQKPICLKCKSENTIKKGYHGAHMRIQCKDCDYRYIVGVTSFIPNIKKAKGDLLDQYLQSMAAGDTVREAAKKCNISPTTAFQWRHLILQEFLDFEKNNKVENSNHTAFQNYGTTKYIHPSTKLKKANDFWLWATVFKGISMKYEQNYKNWYSALKTVYK